MRANMIFAYDAGDTIPSGYHGGRVVVQYSVQDGNQPGANVNIAERFTAVEDQYGLVPHIRTGKYTTDRRGRFDDSIGFWVRQSLPSDFRLVADQEILANGTTAARNRVIWSATSILVTATDGRRPPRVGAEVRLR